MSDEFTQDCDAQLQSATIPNLMEGVVAYGPHPSSASGSGTISEAGRNRARAHFNNSVLESPNQQELLAKRSRHWQLMNRDPGNTPEKRQSAMSAALKQRREMAEMCNRFMREASVQPNDSPSATNQMLPNDWLFSERKTEEQKIAENDHHQNINYLLVQTELFVHFLHRHMIFGPDHTARLILGRLEDDDPRITFTTPFVRQLIEEKVMKKAREAYKKQCARMQAFHAQFGSNHDMEVDVEGDWEPINSLEHATPRMFKGVLNSAQLNDMNWLISLYDKGFSGILSDQMGLGKRNQCIAYLAHVVERYNAWGPFMVLTSGSKSHWEQQLKILTPHLKVVSYSGNALERKRLRKAWCSTEFKKPSSSFHVCINSFQNMVTDMEELNKIPWMCFILDDPQGIIRSHSIRTNALLGLKSRNRLLLSGAPNPNSLAEQWSLLHFIMPTLFLDNGDNKDWFSDYNERRSEKYLIRLHKILKPFMRHVKNTIVKKVVVPIPLTIRQEFNLRKQRESKLREEERKKKALALANVVQPPVPSPVGYYEPTMFSPLPAPQPLGPNIPMLEDDDSAIANLFMHAPSLQKRRQQLERKRKERERRNNRLAARASVVQPSIFSNAFNYNEVSMLSYIPAPQPLGPDTPLLEDDDSNNSDFIRNAMAGNIRVAAGRARPNPVAPCTVTRGAETPPLSIE